MVLCTGDFILFPEYKITKGEITPKTIIEPERVLIEFNYPLTIIKGETKSKIEDFSSEVPVRLGIVYDAVSEFVGQELETNEEGICVSCLLEIVAENDLYVNNFKENEDTEIFVLTDPSSKINEEEFVYNFANEY